MYIDTHCHLNFSRFKKSLFSEIELAHQVGVTQIIVPGTDIPSSRKAIEIAKQHDGIFAAVGIHPHHAFTIAPHDAQSTIVGLIAELSELIQESVVVAVGEVGLDKHVYENTKYNSYTVSPGFMDVQTALLQAQINLAKIHKKTLVLHNRETKKEMLSVLEKEWDSFFEGRSVFHCCEADLDLLTFAKLHHMFIGVDGDVTYDKTKEVFIEKVPLEMLVLETDSPFLLPEPLKSQKQYPNGPRNIPLIAKKIAEIKKTSIEMVVDITTKNAVHLFQLPH